MALSRALPRAILPPMARLLASFSSVARTVSVVGFAARVAVYIAFPSAVSFAAQASPAGPSARAATAQPIAATATIATFSFDIRKISIGKDLRSTAPGAIDGTAAIDPVSRRHADARGTDTDAGRYPDPGCARADSRPHAHAGGANILRRPHASLGYALGFAIDLCMGRCRDGQQADNDDNSVNHAHLPEIQSATCSEYLIPAFAHT